MRKPIWAAVALLSFSIASGNTWAREMTPFVGLKLENHSNIKRLSTDEVEDTVIAPYVGLEFEDATGDYSAAVNARVDFEKYQEGEFSDKTFVELDAYFDWIVQPGRFTWAVEDYSSQYRINIQEADSPGNTQNVNVFATGPDFLFSAGVWELLVKGRVANVAYSETNDDSARLITAISGKLDVNDYSSFNLDSTLSVVDFNEDFLDDYTVLTTGLRYNRELPYGKFHGAVGYNGFDFDSGKDKNDPYFDANLTLELAGSSRFELSGAYKLTDLALESFNPLYTRLLEDLEINSLFEQTTERGASGVYRVKRAFGSYTYFGSRFSTSVFGFVNQQRYFDFVDNNLDENGGGISFTYELSDKLMARAGMSVSDIKYKVADFDVDWKAAEMAAIYNFAENFFMVVGVATEDSQSEKALRDFKNDRIYLTLEYRAKPKLNN